MSAVDEEHTPDAKWTALRIAYLRERNVRNATVSDSIGLSEGLLRAHHAGFLEGFEEAYSVLVQAADKFPRSTEVLERKVYVEYSTGRAKEGDATLAELERVDPTSRVVLELRKITRHSNREWARSVEATQQSLLEQSRSSDDATVAAALRELREWSRRFPRNSTYAINYAIALLGQGRRDEARAVALAAVAIEDGSLSDAYNLWRLLHNSGADPIATASMRRAAYGRATTSEERRFVAEAEDR